MSEFLNRIAAILEVDSVSASDDLRSFATWDSLSALSVIALLDANYGVNMRAADLLNISSIGELWERVQTNQPA